MSFIRIAADVIGRSPSWGAWIEILLPLSLLPLSLVAPPRGERGLKYVFDVFALGLKYASLPLVGSVD